MSTRTPTIGLKKPEGSDPFLTADFQENYDLIDQAFAERPPGDGTGGTGGTGTALTKEQADTYYVAQSHLEGHATGDGGGTTGALTQASGDQRYELKDPTLMRAPQRTAPRVVYSNTGFTMNNQNGVAGIAIAYAQAGFGSVPNITATVEVGNNYDLIVNIVAGTRTTTGATMRVAQKSGIQITTTGTIAWLATGV